MTVDIELHSRDHLLLFMNLWDLPTDLLDLVLSCLSIEDYVLLLQTSKSLKLLFDNNHLYQAVWRANFAQTLIAYEVSYIEEDQIEAGVYGLHALIGKIEFVLERVEKEMEPLQEFLAGDDSGQSLDSWNQIDNLLNDVFTTFVTDEKFFIPIVYVANKYWKEFCEATECSNCTYNISRMCWSRQLLHLQNVNLAVKFLRKADPDQSDDLERFLVEVGRFDNAFPELSKIRVAQIKKLRRHTRSFIPISSGTLKFASEKHFLTFIESLANSLSSLVEHRPCRDQNDRSTGINILREYYGHKAEPSIFRVAILTKILYEEVFGKLIFQIGSEILRFSPKISQQLIMFGKYRLRLRTNSKGFVAENGPLASPAEERIMTMGMNYGKALTLCTAFEMPSNHVEAFLDRIMYSEVPEINFDSSYWSNSMKFMKTLLFNKRSKPNDLVENGLVYFMGMVPFNGPLCFQWAKYIIENLTFPQRFQIGKRNLALGRVIFNKWGDKYGVIAERYDGAGSIFLVYTHNRKVQKMRMDDVEILGRTSPNAARGVMTTQGFTIMGMFYLSEMLVDDEEYRFVSKF